MQNQNYILSRISTVAKMKYILNKLVI